MRKRLRIFISSPGDVQEERLRAHLVVQKLARDYQRFFRIEPYLWEYEPMLASGHFQDAIEPPSQSDILVLVVYSRLGTALPAETAVRAYRGLDGRVPVTGTEWEFEEALEAHRSQGAPDLLAYRKLGDPQVSLADPDRRAEQERQWDSLEAFWRRHFEGGGTFLAGSAKFRTLEEFDAKLEADLARVIELKVAEGLRDVSGAGEEATWLHGSPFQGLAPYDFGDAPIFFGRDAPIRQASTRLQAAAAAGTAFLLVLGASGSGKSSLARAGILPALFAAKAVPGVGLWRRAVLRPGEGGDDPVLGLAKALVAGDPAQGEGLPELLGSGMGAEALSGHLAAAPDDPSFPFRQALGGIAEEARRTKGLLPHEEARLVVLVDQIEELFTREIDPARRALFVRILGGLARSGVVWIVGTVRNDLWHRAAAIPELVELVEGGARLDLPAPDGGEIIEIVRRPAAAAGTVFEKDGETGVGLDAVVSRAASEEPGSLPLLSVVLQELYRRDVIEAGGRALTFASYRALGELRGAIARRADGALAGLTGRDPEAAAALPRVLRALVTAGHDGTATSRPARLDAFATGSPEARLIECLLSPDNRLLVATERHGIAEVRLAHEALLDNWPSAREQIAADRRDLQTRARLETLQRRWLEAATPADRSRSLLTSLNLAEGADLVRRWEIPREAGLGAYVAQSEGAERWRRRRVAIAASVLVLIFAGIAALASLQWRRAEAQADLARAAEATEREARSAADTAREEAVRERDRADAETGRALAALRVARRNAARTLAAQAEISADRSEVHRAMAIAIEAAETEEGVLDPGERSASLPAMLKALADDREVLHLDRPNNGWHTLPHDFYGDDKLAYADETAGILLADLPGGAVRKLAGLPPQTLPLYLRGVPSLGLVVVSSVKNVFVVEVESGRIRAQIPFAERIGAIDVDEAAGIVAVGTGSGIGFIDLAAPAPARVVTVPEVKKDYAVGQVRFVPGTRDVMVGYGASLLRFDRDAMAFGPKLPFELSDDPAGLTHDVADALAAQAYVVVVTLNPDPHHGRTLLSSALNLVSIRPDGSRFVFPRDPNEAPLGLGFTEPDGGGYVISVTGRRSDAGYDLALAYLSDNEGAKSIVFDSFRASASDLNSEQLGGCKLTRANGYLACTYKGKASQGLYVWHVLGGKHRGARLLRGSGAQVSAASLPGETPRLLMGNRSGLVVLPGNAAVPGVAWGDGWRLGAAAGAYVTAASAGEVQVLRASPDGGVSTALPPVGGLGIAVRPGLDRALVRASDRLTLYDLTSGRALWAVPGLAGLIEAEIRTDGTEVIAATREFAYAFDARTGRITASQPIAASPDRPLAIDADARQVAIVTADGPALVDLASGATQPLGRGLAGVATLALDLRDDRVVLGLDDGRVVALDRAGREAWHVAPPAETTFEVNQMPGQKPRGTILQLALSSDGHVAIVRQDMLGVDIHELRSGQYLTSLTPYFTSGVPSRVAFDERNRIVSSWAIHAITRLNPSFVALHDLPLTRDRALSAVRAGLVSSAARAPDGARRPVGPASAGSASSQ